MQSSPQPLPAAPSLPGPRPPRGRGVPTGVPRPGAGTAARGPQRRARARAPAPRALAPSMYSRLYGHIFLVKLTGLLSGFLPDMRTDYHITPMSYTNILLYIQ